MVHRMPQERRDQRGPGARLPERAVGEHGEGGEPHGQGLGSHHGGAVGRQDASVGEEHRLGHPEQGSVRGQACDRRLRRAGRRVEHGVDVLAGERVVVKAEIAYVRTPLRVDEHVVDRAADKVPQIRVLDELTVCFQPVHDASVHGGDEHAPVRKPAEPAGPAGNLEDRLGLSRAVPAVHRAVRQVGEPQGSLMPAQ